MRKIKKACKWDDISLHIKPVNFVWATEMCAERRAVMGGFLDTYLSICFYLILFFCAFSSLCSESSSHSSFCKIQRKFLLNEMHKPGDVILGGLFEVHYTSVFPEQTFTSEPQQPSCKGWVFQICSLLQETAEMMMFANIFKITKYMSNTVCLLLQLCNMLNLVFLR